MNPQPVSAPKKKFFQTGGGFFLIGFLAVAIIGIPLTVYLVQQQQTLEQHAAGVCSTNDVIYCGATTKAAIINAMKYGDSYGHKDIGSIYSNFGITEAGINSSNTVAGRIYRDGRITIGTSQVVATNAKTAGREYISGSTKCWSLWCRPPSISFASGYDYGIAFVHVEKGVFKWAVMTSCGNPALGTAIVTPTSTPTPTIKPTGTPTSTPTSTPTLTPTATPTITPTDTPTDTPTSTPTNTPTGTLTPTLTPTATPTGTISPTSTPTNGPTVTPTTIVITSTPTNTVTSAPQVTIAPTGPANMLFGFGLASILLIIGGGLLLVLL